MKEELDEKLLAALKIAENIADKDNNREAPDADAVMHSLMEELMAETRAEAAAEGVDPEKLRNKFFREKQENIAEPEKETDKEREALELAELLKRETSRKKETDREAVIHEAEPVSKKNIGSVTEKTVRRDAEAGTSGTCTEKIKRSMESQEKDSCGNIDWSAGGDWHTAYRLDGYNDKREKTIGGECSV